MSGTQMGRPPLFYPFWPKPEVYAILLRAGADINARDNCGRTALYDACRKFSMDPTHIRLRTLVGHGADLDTKDQDDRTPLHHAILVDNEEAVKILLEAGCNVEARDKTNRTPLHYAAASGSCVYELLGSGRVDLEALTPEGFTLLICAARDGGDCSALVDAGANVSLTDHMGRTALHWASRQGHEHCVSACSRPGPIRLQRTTNSKCRKSLHWTERIMRSAICCRSYRQR